MHDDIGEFAVLHLQRLERSTAEPSCSQCETGLHGLILALNQLCREIDGQHDNRPIMTKTAPRTTIMRTAMRLSCSMPASRFMPPTSACAILMPIRMR